MRRFGFLERCYRAWRQKASCWGADTGVTLIELLTVIAIVGILMIVGIPEINRFSSSYRARSSATDLLQNMRLARSLAIKENRQYLIVFHINEGNYEIGPDADRNGTID